MTVRYALPSDLAALAAVEAACFPAAEAATEKTLKTASTIMPTISGCFSTAIRW